VDLGLSGRTALVCGASSGLGLASAEALAEEGANVVLFARSSSRRTHNGSAARPSSATSGRTLTSNERW
jgi:3-oxoacyl-[acyl-carrier protein] reductase